MNLANSVVADLLSFSLGMLPSEWARKAKQKSEKQIFPHSNLSTAPEVIHFSQNCFLISGSFDFVT